MNRHHWKEYLPYLYAIIIFLLFTVIYCYPVLEGKVIEAGDMVSSRGMVQEGRKFQEDTGEYSFWTGSMFSGMPNYMIGGGKISSYSYLSPLRDLTMLYLPNTLIYIFCYLLGFFILLKAFKINTWVSIVGAMAITLSSYFFIIIEAGHDTKAFTIGIMGAIIGGFYLIFQKKHLWGALIVMLFSSFGLIAHPQMSYYILMFIGILLLTELYIHIKAQKIKAFFIALAIFLVAIGIGAGTRFTSIQINREYVEETMRGGHSELEKENDTTNKTEGLDLDYATQWSYGIDETMTLLIPNFKGASSNYHVGKNSTLYKTLTKNRIAPKDAEEFCRNVPTYWGSQPFTSGPVYVGAFVVFLFVLGLFIVKGPYKWAILIATLFSFVLSWGKNFMPLTELFFNYFPMYNKFRAVSSILIVAEITMPLLGFLAIKQILDKKTSQSELLISIKKSTYITGGLCLFFALFGSLLYNFISPKDAQVFSRLPEWIGDAIVSERASMLRTDAFRSLAFILLGATLLWYFVREKIKFTYFIIGLFIIVVVDMWSVNKRFLNNDCFVSERQYESYFKKQPYEEYILKDTDPHFRVLNLTTDTFNESRTSYYLKSIGGYHAAKLRRYQDLIDRHISQMNWDVINMLNAKYIIIPGNNNVPIPQLNPDAMGNAWYIDSLLITDTPNQEIDALNTINIRNTAVTDRKFETHVKNFIPGHDSTANVKLLSYTPNTLEYETTANADGIVIFSEIYYPYGWKATIDGQSVEHFRANYTLRGLYIPAGQHRVKFEFQPDIVYKSDRITFIFIFILYATIIGGIGYKIFKSRKLKQGKKNDN